MHEKMSNATLWNLESKLDSLPSCDAPIPMPIPSPKAVANGTIIGAEHIHEGHDNDYKERYDSDCQKGYNYCEIIQSV